MRHLFILACAAAAWLVCQTTTEASQRSADTNPFFGEWRLNTEKSRFVSKPYQTATRTYGPFGADGISARFEIVEADGARRVVTWNARFDGKDYPNTDTAGRFDAVSVRRLDALTMSHTLKMKGQTVQSTTIALSRDGKQLTVTQERADATNVLVFDRQ